MLFLHILLFLSRLLTSCIWTHSETIRYFYFKNFALKRFTLVAYLDSISLLIKHLSWKFAKW